MERNRYAHQRRPRNRDPLERQMDKWVETGRQFVDGVSGNRPGQRRKDNKRSRLTNMGSWVEDKIDWFFEEEEEEWSNTNRSSQIHIEDRLAIKRRPLTAISLRVPKALQASSDPTQNISEWPDASSFKVDRWERESDAGKQINKSSSFDALSKDKIINNRPLPRSSRKRI